MKSAKLPSVGDNFQLILCKESPKEKVAIQLPEHLATNILHNKALIMVGETGSWP